jgi:hypothetical protein
MVTVRNVQTTTTYSTTTAGPSCRDAGACIRVGPFNEITAHTLHADRAQQGPVLQDVRPSAHVHDDALQSCRCRKSEASRTPSEGGAAFVVCHRLRGDDTAACGHAPTRGRRQSRNGVRAASTEVPRGAGVVSHTVHAVTHSEPTNPSTPRRKKESAVESGRYNASADHESILRAAPCGPRNRVLSYILVVSFVKRYIGKTSHM